MNTGGPHALSQKYIGTVMQKAKTADLINSYKGTSSLDKAMDVQMVGGSVYGVLKDVSATVLGTTIVTAAKAATMIGAAAYLLSYIGDSILDNLVDIVSFVKGEYDAGHDFIYIIADYAWAGKGGSGETVETKIRYEKYHKYEAEKKLAELQRKN